MADDLRAFLGERGSSEAEIERAEAEGWLPLLVLDRLLMPGTARFDLAEMARRSGTDVETVQRLWRALGFPDVPSGYPSFTDEDLDALRLALGRFDELTTPAEFLQQLRVISAALTRLASVEADTVASALQTLRDSGLDDREVSRTLVDEFDWASIAALVDYAHRLQLRAAVWRRLARGDDETLVDLSVGFADLSGYTRLSEMVDAAQLAEMLLRFEALAYDTVAELGGRVVKTIGDEVMFVGTADVVAAIALELAERAAADEELPDVRVGVARGPVIAHGGDVYGPVVNLAHRLTKLAYRGTVLAAEAMHRGLHDEPAFTWRRLGPRRVRGIGEVETFVLRRAR